MSTQRVFEVAVERRFLVPSAVARLIQRERGVGTRTIEGYFPPRTDRTQLVRVERDQCFLVLRTTSQDGEVQEEQAELPPAQAEALIEIAVGRLGFDRTNVHLGLGVTGMLDRYIHPAGLDVLTVSIQSDPRLFMPPAWVGREVSGDPAYQSDRLALEGAPSAHSTELTNNDLEALLDWLESRSGITLKWPTMDPTVPQHTERQSEVPANVQIVPAPGPQASSVSSVPDPLPAVDTRSAEDLAVTGDGTLLETYEPVSGAVSDIEDAPVLSGRRPVLRAGEEEPDGSLTRLAKSLAPRRLRSS